ncbi:hypothetical protein Q7P37_003516 [Cladosporium fusiforme]
MGVRNLLCFAQCAAALSLPEWKGKSMARRLLRREDGSDNVTIPVAISVGPSEYWDGIDGPWSSFPLQLGGGTVQKQNVRVMPSTAAYNTWVINEQGCPENYVEDCANSRGFIFNQNDSVTYLPESVYNMEIEDNLGLNSRGYGGYEDITIGWQGSGGPEIDHMPLFDIADSNYWIGVFGLNPLPTNFSTLNSPQPSFMQTLYDQNKIPSRSYGYTAGNQYRFNKVFGSLTLGGYDENRFGSDNATFGFYPDISRDLLVNLKSIKTDKSSPSDLLPGGQISIYLDSTTPNIWLPKSACEAFEKAFNLTYDNATSRYLVNDTLHDALTELAPEVTFTLVNSAGSEVDITLPYGAFDLTAKFPIVQNGTTEHYFPLQRAENDTQYTLGRTFFQEAYLIADYDRGNFTVAPCAWDESAVHTTAIKSILSPNNTEAVASAQKDSDDSGISVGAIVGIVIGLVVAIALLSLALWLLHRRKQKRKNTAAAHLASTDNNEIKSVDGGENKPFISEPLGGELASDAEIHELTAAHKLAPVEMDSPYKTDPNKVGYSEMEGGGYYGPGKGGAHEMHGSTPVFEMEGSEVQELGPGRRSVETDVKR